MAPRDRLAASPAPFVLTLEMDGESFAAFDTLRRQYYPRERNIVPAHVTLFYRLLGEHAREIKALLMRIATHEKRFEVSVGEVKTLQRGVAIFLHSPQLHALRGALADEWRPWLTDLDKAGFRPHVTIQANAGEAAARRTKESVARSVLPPRLRGIGLHLWRYRDGPWEHEQLFRLR